MNLNLTYDTSTLTRPGFHETRNKTAYHAAGKAAAICLGNQQNGLPPVYFQIRINPSAHITHQAKRFANKNQGEWLASIEGGVLITHLPNSCIHATKAMNAAEKLAFEQAFEADIINLLAGPIAKAHYVATSDGELITPRLVNLAALHHYCTQPEMDNLHRRIGCINANDKDKILFRLYLQAFNFVTGRSNWQAIEAIANFLLATEKLVIDYDEIVDVVAKARTKKLSGFSNMAFLM